MPRTDYQIRTDSDVVKTEAKNRYSRDEATVAADAGPLEVGTVMTRAADGALTALAAAGGDSANCVLLEAVPADNAEQRVVVLSRHAEVVLQELRFPEAYATGDQDAAVAALRDLGIVTRKGV